MAESNHHSSREAAAAHSLPTSQPDDPLAGLARLIGQTVAMNDLASDPRRPKPAETARELNLAAQYGYAASDVFQQTSEEQSTPAPVNHELHPLRDSSDDGRYELSSHADGLPQSRSGSCELEPKSQPHTEDLHVDSGDGG
jgi:hypothetical protein